MIDSIRRLSRPFRLRLAAVSAAASLLCGAVLAQPAANQLTISLNPEPSGLVAAFNTDSNLQMVSAKMHEGLLDYDAQLKPVPALAESWTVSADGRTITFRLRKGVKWHDGADFTSADVKFTIEKVLSKLNPRGRATFANLQEVATPDPHTAVIRLSNPAPYLMNGLAAFESPMLPKHVYDDGQDLMRHPALAAPVGTGPFAFGEWKKGSYVLLKRNQNYWAAGRPKLDQVIFRILPDPSVRAVAFEKGEVDLGPMWPVPLPEMERLQKGGKVVANERGYALMSGMLYFGFNVRDGHFKDVRVRRAVAHAINLEVLSKVVWRGAATPATSPISDQLVTFHDKASKGYAYDVKKAEALLDEAGLKRGPDGIRFKTSYDPLLWDENYRRTADFIKQSLKRVGIEMDVRAQDLPTFMRRVWTDVDFDTYSHGSFNSADPTIGVQRLYWGKNILKGVPFSNGSGYSNPAMDQLWERAQTENDPAARAALFRDIQRIAMEDLPYLPLLNLHYQTLQNKRVRGLESSAAGMYGTFADVRVD
ncbi:MAG: ABC transporter substrate-binding protein [Burkholderiaceae bacterium]